MSKNILKSLSIIILLSITNLASGDVNNQKTLSAILSREKNIYKALGVAESFCLAVNQANKQF